MLQCMQTSPLGPQNTWQKPAIKVALTYFLIIQLIGIFLRSLSLWTQGVNYKFVLYGHTHTALTGWVYGILFIALLHFLPQELQAKKSYRWLYWATQLGVLGMLISFPLQGYKAISIVFSTGVILLQYAFCWRLWRDGKQLKGIAWTAIKWSLFFLTLSSLGPWSLGPLMLKFPGSNWYFLAIYFYLHFMYNGFFNFAILGLLIQWWGRLEADIENLSLRRAIQWLAWSCLPAYTLSTLWIEPPLWVWLIAGISALAQFIGLLYLLVWMGKNIVVIKRLAVWPRALLSISLLALVAKIGLQTITALPYFARLAYEVHPFIIGYLHLTFLGFVSFFLLSWLLSKEYLKLHKSGLSLLLLGFLLSEIILFGQGIWLWLKWGSIPGYSSLIFGVTVLMPLGTVLILFNHFRSAKQI